MKKNALCVGVYDPKNIHQASPYPGDLVFATGLEQNGYSVVKMDYREELNPNATLLKLARQYEPSLVWFGKAEQISTSTLEQLRDLLPAATFVKWAADVRSLPIDRELNHNSHFDWYFPTFGGAHLKAHLVPGMTGVASIVTFTNSEYYRPMHNEDNSWQSEVLFTGRTNMRAEVNRTDYLSAVVQANISVTWYGQHNWIGHPEYLYAINGTKIGVGINHFVRPLYSSDRLGNFLACGAFYLSSWFPGIEKVFSTEEIDWFKTPEELVEKIKYYLPKEKLRKRMSADARQKVLKYFDCKPLVANLLHIISTGKSTYSWDDVYLN